jgi:mannose-6-phosphate isomerase-like protein (cupin superfamily)
MAEIGTRSIHNYVELARQNDHFRQTVVTGEHSQVVVMTIPPGEDIGEEVHEGDQILLFVEGEGEALLDGTASLVRENDLAFVPAGTRHNFVNSGREPLRLVTIYAPPEHPDGTVHETKADAEAAEHH